MDNEGKSSFVIGRIPCEDSQQLSVYIQKVIEYEKTDARLWGNKVLFFADDSIQGTMNDLINHENLVWSCSDVMHNWFSEYIFFNDFITGENRIKNTRDSFFKTVNSGTNWVILSAHGHPSHITGEKVLTASDHIYFNNVQTPVILFSMSCSNGAFYRNTDSSMCKSYLFTPNGGAVVYIGSTNIAYAFSNTQLIQSVCMMNDTNPQPNIGCLLTLAKKECYSSYAMDYHIFGDPAIRINRSRMVDVTLLKGNNSVVCNINDSSFAAGYISWQIRKKKYESGYLGNIIRDSTLYSGNQIMHNRSFTISVSQDIPDSACFTLYVWNDSLEGRAGFEFHDESAVRQRNSQMSSISLQVKIVHSRYLEIFFGTLLSGPATMELYQLNGRQTYSVTIPPGSDSYRYEFNSYKCPGTSIVVLRRDKKILGKQLVHFW